MSATTYSKFTRVYLEAEVAPATMAEFTKKYALLTGGESASASGALQRQDNKWGKELRVYFDGPDLVVENLETLGYHIENRLGGGYRSNYGYRINSEELFWKLVRHGYRLGENGPVVKP